MKDYRISLLADYYGDMLIPKALETVRFYYDDDLSLSEIAEQQGVSRQAISESLAKSVGLLYEWEDKLGLAVRHDEVTELTEQAALAIREGDAAQAVAILAQIAELV